MADEIADWVTASAALPLGLVAPMSVGSHSVVDGAVADNVPEIISVDPPDGLGDLFDFGRETREQREAWGRQAAAKGLDRWLHLQPSLSAYVAPAPTGAIGAIGDTTARHRLG